MRRGVYSGGGAGFDMPVKNNYNQKPAKLIFRDPCIRCLVRACCNKECIHKLNYMRTKFWVVRGMGSKVFIGLVFGVSIYGLTILVIYLRFLSRL